MQPLQAKYEAIAKAVNPYIILPPFGYGLLLVSCNLYAIATVARRQAAKPTAYSKFTRESKRSMNQLKVSGKMLQTIAYGIPLSILLGMLFYGFKAQNKYNSFLSYLGWNSAGKLLENQQLRFMLPAQLMVLHFVKRIFEAHFVHLISNDGPVFGAAVIGIGYSVASGAPLYFQQKYVKKEYYAGSTLSLQIGLLVYFTGIFGNFYHHLLLRWLRLNNTTDNKYVLPTGGIFELVWCPHYFFEIIGWFGVGVVSKHSLQYLSAAMFGSYLYGRSIATKEWYEKKFVGHVRNALVPFLL